jgi:hypothetical protein
LEKSFSRRKGKITSGIFSEHSTIRETPLCINVTNLRYQKGKKLKRQNDSESDEPNNNNKKPKLDLSVTHSPSLKEEDADSEVVKNELNTSK